MRILLAILSLMLLGEIGSASTLSWHDCARIASVNNSDLRIARSQLIQAEANLSYYKSSALPQLGLSSSLSRSKSSSATDSLDSLSLGLSTTYTLFDGGRIYASIRNAQVELVVEQYSYKITEAEVRYTVYAAYVQLWKAQSDVILARSILERRQNNLEAIELRYKAGREHRGSMRVADADQEQAVADLAKAMRAEDLTKTALQTALGDQLAITDVVPFNDKDIRRDISTPNFNQLVIQHPRLLQYHSDTEVAQIELDSTSANGSPEVSVRGSLGTGGSILPLESNSWSVGLFGSWDWFDGGGLNASIAMAKQSLAQAEFNEKKQKVDTLYNLREQWNLYLNTRDTLSVKTKYLAAAEERANIASAQYANGLITFDSWTIIEDSLVNSRKAILNAQVDLLLARASWIQSIGGGLDYAE